MKRNYLNANTVVRKIDLSSNDTDKIMVEFVDVGEDGSPEVFPDSPNGNFIIMSIAEYALLKQQETFSICDDTFEINNFSICYNSQGKRHAEVYIQKVSEYLPVSRTPIL